MPSPQNRARKIKQLFFVVTACCIFLVQGCASKPKVYTFYPPKPDIPRLQLLAIYTAETDLYAKSVIKAITGDSYEYSLRRAYGVTFDKGKLLVVDSHKQVNGYASFDLIKKKLKVTSGPFKKPIAVAVDQDGKRYVTDTGLPGIFILDKSDNVLTSFKTEGFKPGGISVTDQYIFISDILGGHIHVFDKRNNQKVKSIGEGKLGWPTGIDLDSDGNIYIAEAAAAVLSKYDFKGNRLTQFGELGDRMGQFIRPKDVAVDRDGRVYGIDAATQHAQIYNQDGRLLLAFGGATTGADAMILPSSIKIDYDNVPYFQHLVTPDKDIEYLVAITSQGSPNRGSKVAIYGFLKDKPVPPQPAK